MGVKDVLTREKDELVAVRRPYETAAFIIFALLMFQELFYLIRGIVNFFKNGFYNTGNIGMIAQNQGFIRRFIQLDSTKLMIVLIAMLLVLLYYALIWLLVWNYCRKQGLPKWTWTTIVVFIEPNASFIKQKAIYTSISRSKEKLLLICRPEDLLNCQSPEDERRSLFMNKIHYNT